MKTTPRFTALKQPDGINAVTGEPFEGHLWYVIDNALPASDEDFGWVDKVEASFPTQAQAEKWAHILNTDPSVSHLIRKV